MDQETGLQARYWIDGEWVERGTPAESIDPATGEVTGRYTLAGASRAQAAVAAASAFARRLEGRPPAARTRAEPHGRAV